MRKAIIIVLSMSLCIFAEAQKALEWEVKAGTYVEVFKLPIHNRYRLVVEDSKSYATFSIAALVNKWNTLLQVNIDTRLTLIDGVPKWSPSYYKANFVGETNNVYSKTGDTVYISSNYSNILNVLHNFIIPSNKHKLYAGVGITGRKDVIEYVAYTDGFLGVLDFYTKIRVAPTLKAEYQFNVSNHFFLSSNLNYSYFFNTPHSYWQCGVSLGLKI